MARHLHEQGFNVFAGCLLRDSEGAADLASISESMGRMTVLQLDVTKEEDWEDACVVKKLMIKSVSKVRALLARHFWR